MENKQPANTWIRPKSTGMEVDDDNDLDSVFKEELPLPAPQEAYAEVMKHVESIYPAKNTMPGQSIPKEMIEIETVNTATPATEKKTRTRAPKATTGKTATPEEMIALMEAKIEVLKSIQSLNWGGGTGDRSTPDKLRPILIEIAESVEGLKAKYTEVIANL